MATETTILPEMIYGLVWTSLHAGDVPADSIETVSLDLDDPKFADRRGEETYDGVSMASRGRFVVRAFRKPQSIATLEAKFGGRVVFGVCTDGSSLGCWIDGDPHRFGQSWPMGWDWTWDREESDYLECLARLRGQLDDDDDND